MGRRGERRENGGRNNNRGGERVIRKNRTKTKKKKRLLPDVLDLKVLKEKISPKIPLGLNKVYLLRSHSEVSLAHSGHPCEGLATPGT